MGHCHMGLACPLIGIQGLGLGTNKWHLVISFLAHEYPTSRDYLLVLSLTLYYRPTIYHTRRRMDSFISEKPDSGPLRRVFCENLGFRNGCSKMKSTIQENLKSFQAERSTMPKDDFNFEGIDHVVYVPG